MSRGFEVVKLEARKHLKDTPDLTFDERVEINGKRKYSAPVKLPTRADKGSAGYDFYLLDDVELLPAQKTIVWTDVKAFMEEDELLEIYIRSSLAIKNGIMLSNNVGIVDSSYYSNEDNDGNIGIALVNTSGKAVKLKRGERIAQGIFKKFLTSDDKPESERTGGFGSSGK